MIRFVLLTALAVSGAIAGGAASALYVIDNFPGLDAIAVGEWVANPAAGTNAADPYSRARIAREAIIPLGAAEGLSFIASHDRDGGRLALNCRYRVAGTTPSARLWTLHAINEGLAVITSPARPRGAIHSREVQREADNSVVIHVGASPYSGNWLPLSGSGPFRLILTLYDTPIATSGTIAELKLPRIEKVSCDG